MPAQSKAQLGWIFANLGKEEGRKWARDTPNIKDLPEHKKDKRKETMKKIFNG